MIYLECVNLDNEYRFIKECNTGVAIKFLRELLYSPHIRCIAYEDTSPVPSSEVSELFARQVQYVLPILEYVRSFPQYTRRSK